MKNTGLQIESKKQMIDYIKQLPIRGQSDRLPDVFLGLDEVCSAWEEYWNDMETAAYEEDDANLLELIPTPGNVQWTESESFLVLVGHNSFWAIRDYGRYKPDLYDFLFKTSLIPLFTNAPLTPFELLECTEKTINLFYSELQQAEKSAADKKPLFLLSYIEQNNYTAWSIAEDKEVTVRGYKSYIDHFLVLDRSTDMPKIIPGKDYVVYPPSDDLILLLSLDLVSEFWNKPMSWDGWVKRPERIPVNLGEHSPSSYRDEILKMSPTYLDAITIANKGRAHYYKGTEPLFIELERRLDTFEKLVSLGSPTSSLKMALDTITDSVKKLTRII